MRFINCKPLVDQNQLAAFSSVIFLGGRGYSNDAIDQLCLRLHTAI